MIRIGFFGTPYLARCVLEDLSNSSDFEIAFVVTNPDKPFGRSGEMKASPVKEFAEKKHIPILQPAKIRDNKEFLHTIGSYGCDYFIVVAYGKILPIELLEIPKKMCINVHGSILPKYRGASPIQAVLLAGERETGVTIMKMSEGMDEGDILKIRNIQIDQQETSESLFDKFASISGPTLIQTLRELEHGGITLLPQDHTEATYCTKIEKEEGLIDWSQSAKKIYHMWQAYTPWPGIYTIYQGKRLIFEKVSLLLYRDGGNHLEKQKIAGIASEAHNDVISIGQVVKMDDGKIGAVCPDGILVLEQIKLEGKKSQNISDFVNGQKGFVGYKFGHEFGVP